MKALVFDLNIPKYLVTKTLSSFFAKRYFSKMSCLSLKEIPCPKPPNSNWVLIKLEACGICGSDLAALSGRESFSMEPYSSFPAVLGHEAIGKIEELGEDVKGFGKGDRVAIDSILPCVTREIEPPCPACSRGKYSLCENFREGSLKPGPVNGFNASVGGGFAEYMLAHKSQLFSIPREMDTKKAVLVDPLASVLQPVVTHFPSDDEVVLVYGCGIIGNLVIRALRAMGSNARIIAITKYDFQGELAKKADVNEIIGKNIFNEFRRVTGSKLIKPPLGKPVFEGGVDVVFDCVGSSDALDNSMRFLKKRGKLVLIGTAGVLKKVDITPVWFKEIVVTGSAMYSNVFREGKSERTYGLALDLLAKDKIDAKGLVTHEFKLGEYEKAINTALNKKKTGSVKVVLTP